jgi:hypothetical protein
MSNIQIPNLPAVISVSGTEQLECVQAGVSSRVTINQIKASFFGSLGNYANDAAAAAGGIAVGGLYRNGSVVMVRVS